MTRDGPSHDPAQAAGEPPRDGLTPPTLYWAMLVIASGICLSVLDATLISVASSTDRQMPLAMTSIAQ